MQDYNLAFAYVSALTQSDANTATIDVRMIHDSNKAVPAIPRRGTLPQLWNEIVAWNNLGYGAFINVNEMDGIGREIANVAAIRCQVVDFDNLSAAVNFERATQWQPAPAFAVQSSPGKFHAYWITQRHNNKDGFTLLQRKLRALFDGDKTIIDASRVLRLPGTLHLKNPSQPHLVTVWALAGYGVALHPAQLEQALQHVNVIDGAGGRHDLGDASLAAPGLEWCIKALDMSDPNTMDRGEWIGFSSAWKQAAWAFAPEQTLYDLWSKWCARYETNDPAENLKNWNSIRNTEIGWASLERRIPGLQAMRLFGEKQQEFQQQQSPSPSSQQLPAPPPSAPPVPHGEWLTDTEQQEYFKGCVFIEKMGNILTPSGRFMNATQFNGSFGGKNFIIDSTGKHTKEAWNAATRSTLWTIPKADHIRFMPSQPYSRILSDALGRSGVNTYKPAVIDARPGDISPFLRNMELILPMEADRRILFDYLAHNIKYPGYKIPWAPLIQSVEGVGKGLMKRLMIHALGAPYTYFPKAQELIQSGSKFNAWMRSKLFILVDEIKVDERRDMIEILKPMISEEQIEIQSKGIDQDMEDNFANWMFYSNYKDAIPVNKNSRRFAIFYSAIQTADDLRIRGMNESYFQKLYEWMRNGGDAYVTHWFQNYRVERGAIPMRAPDTSSTLEAVEQSRGPVETIVLRNIMDGLAGFRGGWVSSLAVAKSLKGTTIRHVSAKTLTAILGDLGYYPVGRAPRPYLTESPDQRADLFNVDRAANVQAFAAAQGYQF